MATIVFILLMVIFIAKCGLKLGTTIMGKEVGFSVGPF